MPKHEFGLMPTDPIKGKRYDWSEPQEYNCITVNDDYILPLLNQFKVIKCYWHTIDRCERGLAYWGITLIPPESIAEMIEVVRDVPEMRRLLEMLVVADRERKFVIHFGV